MASVEIGITHEFVIEGEKCWVRLAITKQTESDSDKAIQLAAEDLSEQVNKELIKVIEDTIEAKKNYNR